MTDPVAIRPAVPDDADGIAAVNVRSWREGYRGLIPQPYLDELSVEDRSLRWREIISDPSPDAQQRVAERDGAILGWAAFGSARVADDASAGELWGLYVDPEVWSGGIGSRLIECGERWLRDRGFVRAYLWVLDGNVRADRFYERRGWHLDGETRIDERPAATLHEHRRTKLLKQ